ncbi:LemA family protein [Desulfobotulus sp.]|uniref:LemA family protein n=1 Tax=Desulfobotulus sp. TaxID=1940337 RepID=UPI002A360154|nr:LemA family protein [Desulfobotulus sp.]MDY0162328.1 LemA family protein [Desulfobotulus sp.]
MRLVRRCFAALLACLSGLACFFAATAFFDWGFESMREARQLDRLPPTPVAALAHGPYALQGKAITAKTPFTAPYSGESAIYLRYRLEQEYRDSDDRIQLRTLDQGERKSPFILADATGAVWVDPRYESHLEIAVSRTYREKRGDRIYSEWVITQGQSIRLLGAYSREHQVLHFDTRPWNLPALMTDSSLQAKGGESLFTAGILISIASGLVALAMAFLLIALQVHRFWVYVFFMTCGGVGFLWYTGLLHLQRDWEEAAMLYKTRQEAILPTPSPAQRMDLYAMRLLIEKPARNWPDRPLFHHVAAHRFPLPQGLSDVEKEAAALEIARIPSSRYENLFLVSLLSGAGCLLGMLTFFLGIRLIKRKRLMEHIPTAKSQGLSYGMAELKGRIFTDQSLPCIQSKLNAKDCVACHYKIQEEKKSGDKTKWVTIEEAVRATPFWLQDDEGRVKVHPKDAEIEFSHTHTEYRGKYCYTESWLVPDAKIYCIGFAGLDPDSSQNLSLQKGKTPHTFFFISHRKEEEILRSKGARGFLSTSISLAAFLFAASVLWAGMGWLTPATLFQTALLVPLLLMAYTLILHYNDMVFLKNRCLKAASDMDTILQKRADLWPQLERIVQAYLSHEKTLLSAIASLRRPSSPPEGDVDAADRIIQNEQQVSRHFMARLENYPELKGQALVQNLADEMRKTENYLALLRQGYSDSVEIYNTRIQSFPDFILALIFRFKKKKPFTSQT